LSSIYTTYEFQNYKISFAYEAEHPLFRRLLLTSSGRLMSSTLSDNTIPQLLQITSLDSGSVTSLSFLSHIGHKMCVSVEGGIILFSKLLTFWAEKLWFRLFIIIVTIIMIVFTGFWTPVLNRNLVRDYVPDHCVPLQIIENKSYVLLVMLSTLDLLLSVLMAKLCYYALHHLQIHHALSYIPFCWADVWSAVICINTHFVQV